MRAESGQRVIEDLPPLRGEVDFAKQKTKGGAMHSIAVEGADRVAICDNKNKA